MRFDDQLLKAISFEQFEFPYSHDDERWVRSVIQLLKESATDSFKAIVLDDMPTSIIPSDLFPEDDDALLQIMQLEHGLKDGHKVYRSTLNAFDAQYAGLVPSELSARLPSSQIVLAFNAWVPSLLRRPTSFHAHLHVSNQRFRLAVLAGRDLLLHNQQPCDTADDVLYFTLATLEQLSILHTEVRLVLYGSVQKGDETHDLFCRYIASVELAERPSEYTYSYSFKDLPAHASPYLLNAPLCAS
jgi:hypothetical protein